MKKVLVLFGFLIFFLAGCKTLSPDVTAVTTGLEFSAKVMAKEEEYNLFVTVAQDGSISISDLESGATFSFEKEQITVSLDGINYKTELSQNLENSVIGYIFSVLKSASLKQDEVYFKDGEYYLCDKAESFDYTLYLGQTGLPLKLCDTEHNIQIDISNAAII